MGNIEPGAKAVLWSETRQPIQTWTTQMRGLINSITFPGMVLDVKGAKTGHRSRVSTQYDPSQSLCFFLLFRWEDLWQGPCGDHAGERGEAEPTVGDRTAVKTCHTTWESDWKPELLQPATRVREGGKLPELLQGCEWSHRGAETHNLELHISLSFCFGKKVWRGRAGKKRWRRRRRLVRLQLLGSQLPLEKRTTHWTACK